MEQLIKALAQKLGRPPTQAEISAAAREAMGATKKNAVPAPPGGGITRENIKEGYGYPPEPGVPSKPGTPVPPGAAEGMSPLKKMLMIGGPAAALLGLYALSQQGDTPTAAAPGSAPNFRAAEDASMARLAESNMPKRNPVTGDYPDTSLRTRIAIGKLPPRNKAKTAPAAAPAVPTPPQGAALMDDAALREYFNSGPYSLNIGNR